MSEKGLFAVDGQSCVETELEADSPFSRRRRVMCSCAFRRIQVVAPRCPTN